MSQWDKILWCKYLICSWSNRHLPPMLLHLPRHLTLHVTPLIQHVYVYGSRRRCQNVIRQSQPNGFCGSACVTNITPCNCYYASNSGHCYCSQKNSPSTNHVWCMFGCIEEYTLVDQFRQHVKQLSRDFHSFVVVVDVFIFTFCLSCTGQIIGMLLLCRAHTHVDIRRMIMKAREHSLSPNDECVGCSPWSPNPNAFRIQFVVYAWFGYPHYFLFFFVLLVHCRSVLMFTSLTQKELHATICCCVSLVLRFHCQQWTVSMYMLHSVFFMSVLCASAVSSFLFFVIVRLCVVYVMCAWYVFLCVMAFRLRDMPWLMWKTTDSGDVNWKKITTKTTIRRTRCL